MMKFEKGLFKIVSICVGIYLLLNTAAYSLSTLRNNSLFDEINKVEETKRPRELLSKVATDVSNHLNGTSYNYSGSLKKN